MGRARVRLSRSDDRDGPPAYPLLRWSALGVGCLAAAAALAWATRDRAPGLDRAVHDFFWSRRSAVSTDAASVTTWLGSIWVLVPALVLVTVLLPWTRLRLRRSLPLLASFGVAVLLRSVLQPTVQRPRPVTDGVLADGPGFSFPSGHTLQIVVALGLLILVYPPRGRVRLPVAAGAVLLVLLVGWTRLALGVHWFTDVLGGALLGGVVLSLHVLATRIASRSTARNLPAIRRG